MGLRFAAVALLASVGLAQDQVIRHVENRGQGDERAITSVALTSFAGSARSGGLGFVLVDAVNHDNRAHRLEVQFSSRSWTRNSVDARRSLVMGPNERARFFLPLPGLSRYAFELEVWIDSVRYSESLQPATNRGPVALLIGDRPQLTSNVLGLAQQVWPGSKRAKATTVMCGSRDVPNDWRLLTAFHLVVVDGMSQVGRDVQETVRRFVHAGGRALVIGPDRMPVGALRDRLEATDSVWTLRHGLGTMTGTRTTSLESSSVVRELTMVANASIWPLTEQLQMEQRIPGLDRAPVLMFLFVILLFAIAVGPVNFYLLRKAKRPMLALVTVPAIGFGTTLLMFGYAIVNDGFGVRGVVKSWTLLDQASHEATSISTRTLFAGLTPGALSLGDDTMLLAPEAFQRPDNRSRHRWSYDGDTGQIDGGVVPARTTTVLASARQGVTRERLRAQVRTDGDLDLLTDGGVVPVGDVLLRDRDGRYWYGQSPKLQPCNAADAERQLEKLQRNLRVHEAVDRGTPHLLSVERLSNSLLGSGLPRGGYITQVRSAPWGPDHGIAVDYEREQHFVVGVLGAEDFVQ